MNMPKTLHVTTRAEWRSWLQEFHDQVKEVWLIFYKKHTAKPRLAYNDAVEEALCFGWIDSISKRIDEEKYAQKFTPRNADSKWSELNKQRAEQMIRAGLMTEAGLVLVEAARQSGAWEHTFSRPKELITPPEILEALAANKKAQENFDRLAPSLKRQYVGWISSAKKEDTRLKRIREVIEVLAQNKKLGLK